MAEATVDSLQMPCATCKAYLAVPVVEVQSTTSCPNCQAPIEVRIFPAFGRGAPTGAAPQAVVSDAESSCFYHPASRASVACDHCGRFLCSLCDIEVGGRHLCTQCIQAPAEKASLKTPERYVHWDNVALTVAILPVLFSFATIVTAPLAIFLSLRHWNTPQSVVPRRRYRFVLAIVIALLQLVFWLWLVGAMLGVFFFLGEEI